MIGSLRGTLADLPAPGEVIVEVNGVGYRVSVPTSVVSSVDGIGSQLFLHVHTHVREDAIVLFGFVTADERRCFEALLGSHGVGPALALAILSSLSPAALSAAVLAEDVDTLCTVPGVGKKTAARLVLELSTRLDLPAFSGGARPVEPASPLGETRAALTELGYGPDEIRKALDGADEGRSVEELIRSALHELARTR